MSANEAANTQGEPEASPDAFPEPKSISSEPLGPDNPHIFKHAPPKPEGDLWEILLKPALDADTTRCDAWKDEVSALLIFAGLFSAVVTAFVIESYKFLQPGPNDAVVGLLFHIANSLNSTTPFPPAVNPASIATPFTQTSTSIRINICWFISLILSLTTVLVGTISLQWLREHQSYPDVSSKEKLAIFHMRSEALDVWFVPQIFSALPVLLQGALALFLAGLIDFVLPLGSTLTIPVCVIIGLTLLFLAATTVLPTCQAFMFLTGFYPYSKPPTLCAFKSPQSRVLLSIFAPFIRVLCFLIFLVSVIQDFHPSMFHRHAALPYLQKVLEQSTWPNLDWAWLRLRDAYHQCIFDNDPLLYFHQRDWSRTNCFPISDITQYLVKSVAETPTVKDREMFLAATIHCFQEISASIWTDIPRNGDSHLEGKVRHNNYFEQLLQLGMPSCSVPMYIFRRASYETHGNKELTTIQQTYKQEQMLYFLVLICQPNPSPQISQYQLELWLHIISEVQKLPLPSGSHSQIPMLLDPGTFHCIYFGHPFGSPRFAAVADMLSAVFKSAAGHHISQDQSLDSLCTHSQMAKVLCQLASWINEWAQQNISDTYNRQHVQDINARYNSIFKFMANHLNNEISDLEQNSEEDTPSVLFYLASIFVWEVFNWLWRDLPPMNKFSGFGQGLGSLLEALLQYRTQTSGRKNDLLEKRFAGAKEYSWAQNREMVRFSEEWWDILFEFGRDIGLMAAEQGPAVTGGSGLSSRPRLSSSSQDEQESSGIITTPVVPSSPSTPLGVIDSSPASNAPSSDEDIVDPEVSHGDPRPPSLTRADSKLDDHDEGTKGQSSSDSLAIDNHATATNEVPDSVINPTLAHSPPDFHANDPPDGIYAADRATIQIPSPSSSSSPAPPPPSDEAGTSPPEVTANVSDDEQAPIHPGAPHLAIDVGSPTGSGRGEVAEVADAGDGAPEGEGEARSEDAVVGIDSPN